jgi:FlaA1/EpsC-like NDP-sugar epimerase
MVSFAEELFHEGEKLVDTKHKKISKSLSRQHDFSDVSASLERLLDCCNQSKLSSAVNELLLLVPEAKLESNRSNNLD